MLLDLLTTQHWTNITQRVTNQVFPLLLKNFNTRLKSELVSAFFENEACEYYKTLNVNVVSAKTDREPDLFFKDFKQPLEIKVTKEKKNIKWMGNNISKRESHFVLVVWSEHDTFLRFYITATYLTPENWKKSEKNYNASFLQLKDINDKIDLVKHKDFYYESF